MGTPWTKRAYNLGLKAVPNFEALSEEAIAYYEQNLDQIPVALARGFIIEQSLVSTEKPAPLLSVGATFDLGAVAGKKTKKCFLRPRYVYRDADFDNWLPANQPSADACAITTLGLSRDWTFAEVAAAALGIGAGTSIQMLGKALIENGHTMTLVQAEDMVVATERGEKTGMRTDGYGNFFFVETGNEENPVSVGYVTRVERSWSANVYRLGLDFRWYAVIRLLLRNLDTSKLGL